MIPMTRAPFYVVALAGVVLSGCHDPSEDVRWIDMIVPHHQLATRMADQVLERGSRPEVRELAGRMKEAQEMEIAQLKRIREEVTGSPETPPPGDPHGLRDVEFLKTLSGKALDEAFLRHMIPHHSQGVVDTHERLPGLHRRDTQILAVLVLDDQTREIREMEDMRCDRSKIADVSAMPDPNADLRLIDEMVPHHRMAIQMAREVKARGFRPDVRKLAAHIIREQEGEIARMTHIRAHIAGSPEVPPRSDPHAEADLQRLKSLSGAELDTEFLIHMIPHHAMAIVTSHEVFPDLKRADLREISAMMFRDQAVEIGRMRRLLRTFPVPAGPSAK